MPNTSAAAIETRNRTDPKVRRKASRIGDRPVARAADGEDRVRSNGASTSCAGSRRRPRRCSGRPRSRGPTPRRAARCFETTVAGAAHQALEQRELAAVSAISASLGARAVRVAGSSRRSPTSSIAGARPAAAPQQRAQPGDEHDERERLRQEVVGAGVEGFGFVVLAVLGGEHEDRCPDALLAQGRADLVAVHARAAGCRARSRRSRRSRGPARDRRGRCGRCRRRSPRRRRPRAMASASVTSSSITSTRTAPIVVAGAAIPGRGLADGIRGLRRWGGCGRGTPSWPDRVRTVAAVDDREPAAAHLGGAMALLRDAAGAVAANGPAAQDERRHQEQDQHDDQHRRLRAPRTSHPARRRPPAAWRWRRRRGRSRRLRGRGGHGRRRWSAARRRRRGAVGAAGPAGAVVGRRGRRARTPHQRRERLLIGDPVGVRAHRDDRQHFAGALPRSASRSPGRGVARPSRRCRRCSRITAISVRPSRVAVATACGRRGCVKPVLKPVAPA